MSPGVEVGTDALSERPPAGEGGPGAQNLPGAQNPSWNYRFSDTVSNPLFTPLIHGSKLRSREGKGLAPGHTASLEEGQDPGFKTKAPALSPAEAQPLPSSLPVPCSAFQEKDERV